MGQGGNPPAPVFDFYPLHTLPPVLGIVWCQFPEQEMPSKPGPKTRPALVRTVGVNQAGTKAKVAVTYGTSRLKEDERFLDLIISNCSEMNAAGLPQATRFDLDDNKTIWLPWAREFFTPREGFTSPLIGRLPANAAMQLQTLIVFRRKEAQQAAIRNQQQRPGQ